MKYIITLILLILGLYTQAQKHKSSQQLNFEMSGYDAIHIYNTGGEIAVQSNNGRTAKMDIVRTIKAKSQKKLKRAIAEIMIDTMIVDNELVIFVNTPYQYLDGSHGNEYLWYRSTEEHSNNYRGLHEIGIEYRFKFDISLPTSTNLIVSTHRGDLKVDGIRGRISAINHHNNVDLVGVRDVVYAHSHHGDVEVSFIDQPNNDINLDTHHGDIKIFFPKTPSAQVEFDSYHGSFYTDFDWHESPLKLEKVQSRSKRKTEYKVGNKTRVTMGSGSHKITFNTHHGDMYILEK